MDLHRYKVKTNKKLTTRFHDKRSYYKAQKNNWTDVILFTELDVSVPWEEHQRSLTKGQFYRKVGSRDEGRPGGVGLGWCGVGLEGGVGGWGWAELGGP